MQYQKVTGSEFKKRAGCSAGAVPFIASSRARKVSNDPDDPIRISGLCISAALKKEHSISEK
jgi:hypothetical protein